MQMKSLTTLTTPFFFTESFHYAYFTTIKMKSLTTLITMFYLTTIQMKYLTTLTTLFFFTNCTRVAVLLHFY